MLPEWVETEFTFAFSCWGMKNSGQHGSIRLQQINR